MSKSFKRIKAKLLTAYYGNGNKKINLICVVGDVDSAATVHYVHDIISAAGYKVDALEMRGFLKLSVLHKFINNAWKSGAEYVVVSATAADLDNQIFHGLDIHTVAVTEIAKEKNCAAYANLLQTVPKVVVLNGDDLYHDKLRKYAGTVATLVYGTGVNDDIRIAHSKLYRKGTEVSLIIGNKTFTAATFATGESYITSMVCATAVATALKIDTSTIADGIAEYEPEEK